MQRTLEIKNRLIISLPLNRIEEHHLWFVESLAGAGGIDHLDLQQKYRQRCGPPS